MEMKNLLKMFSTENTYLNWHDGSELYKYYE